MHEYEEPIPANGDHSAVVSNALEKRLEAFDQIPALAEISAAARKLRLREKDSTILLLLMLCERSIDRIVSGLMEQVESLMGMLPPDPVCDLP
jgi:hypothetical protein